MNTTNYETILTQELSDLDESELKHLEEFAGYEIIETETQNLREFSWFE